MAVPFTPADVARVLGPGVSPASIRPIVEPAFDMGPEAVAAARARANGIVSSMPGTPIASPTGSYAMPGGSFADRWARMARPIGFADLLRLLGGSAPPGAGSPFSADLHDRIAATLGFDPRMR